MNERKITNPKVINRTFTGTTNKNILGLTHEHHLNLPKAPRSNQSKEIEKVLLLYCYRLIEVGAMIKNELEYKVISNSQFAIRN
jgi:hypothetical protein